MIARTGPFKNSKFENPSSVFGLGFQDMGPFKSSKWLTQHNQSLVGLLGLKKGSRPLSLTNKVGHEGQSTYTTHPIPRALSRQRISLSARGEGYSRGERSTIACDEVLSSTDRRSIVSESSLQSAESASHLDCDEVM